MGSLLDPNTTNNPPNTSPIEIHPSIKRLNASKEGYPTGRANEVTSLKVSCQKNQKKNESSSYTTNNWMSRARPPTGWNHWVGLMATLPKTNVAPKNGWWEYDPFLLGRPIFRGYVSFRECI